MPPSSGNTTTQIDNVAPTVTAGPLTVSAYASFTLPVGAFTDPGFTFPPAATIEKFTATVDWNVGAHRQ